ncbi:MAG TPA: aldo/keto reductase [Pseudorhodoplanes sp.]|nr:aldo/keto reductase [Pseudorhodoplanes sp.]
MQYVRLGTTGLKVSRLSLGTLGYGDPKWHEWTLGEDAARPFFKAALEKGINFFDTADAYSAGVSEIITGNALKEMARRDEVVIATKVCRPMGPGPNQKGLSRKHIMESIDASLRRLKTDYVDLYIIHRFDPDTPVEETLAALNDVVRAGKALYLGASSMYAWQFAKMLTMQRERGLAPFVSMQNLYNLIYREEEREMHPLCVAEGIALTPYSPNARGFLAGNTRAGSETTRGKTDKMTARMQLGATKEDHAIADRVADLAGKLGAPMASVALAWVLAQKGMTAPVIGVSKMQHLDDAIRALDMNLDAGQMKYLEEPYRPKPVVAMD